MVDASDVTAAELAVLQLLWDAGEATVRDLTDALYPGGGSSPYGTVQKLLQRLEAKGGVRCRRDAVPHVYAATMAREDLVDLRLSDLVDKLCAGSLLPVLTHLTRRRKLSASERDELRDFLDELRDFLDELERAAQPGRRRR